MIELVHVHIPKCAGMSVRAVLRAAFGDALVGTPICNTGSELLDFLAETGHDTSSGPVAVTGHAPWTRAAHWETRYVIPVRDPVERVYSWFRFCRGQTCLTPARMLATGQAGLHGWRLDNVITRFMAGLPLDSTRYVDASDASAAVRAVRRAGSRVCVLPVGQLDAWAAAEGLGVVPRENVSAGVADGVPVVARDHPWVRWDVQLLEQLGVA